MKTLQLVFLIFICNISISKAQYYQWANTFYGDKDYAIAGICSDTLNNVFVSSTNFAFSTFRTIEIHKIDSAGILKWLKTIPYNGLSQVNAGPITKDFAGNCYVSVYNSQYPSPLIQLDSNLFVSFRRFIVKFSTTGEILRVDSLEDNYYNNYILADSIGNLYITDDSQTKKLNKYGVQVWANPLIGGTKLAIDNQKRVYVFQNDSIFKLNSNGITLWVKKYNGNDFAVDKTGNIYVATNDSIYKLNSSGILVWSNTSYHGNVITIDPAGKIYLAEGTNTYKLSNSGSLLKWSMGSVNAEIMHLNTNDQNCYIAGGFNNRNETSFCPFHFSKIYTSSQAASNSCFLAKINQSSNMPFQASIYTPAITDDFLCSGMMTYIPYVVCTNSNSVFGINNEFRAQLSNSAGGFVDIGLASSAIIPLTVPKGNNYRVRVVSTNPVVIGDPNSYGYFYKNLSIDPITSDIINTSPVSLCAGDSISLNALVADSSKNYSWYLNDSGVASGYGYKLNVNQQGEYRLLVRDPAHFGCIIYSDSIIVNSYPKPSASIIASGPLSFCAGDSVIFTTSAGNFYQWKKNNVNIIGATFQNYTAKTNGAYKVKLTNSFGCTKISTPKTVSIICKEDLTQPIKEYEIYSQQNQLTFTNKSSNAMKIALYNMNGEMVSGLKLVHAGSEHTYYVQNTGMYLLRIIENSNVYWEKVIAGK